MSTKRPVPNSNRPSLEQPFETTARPVNGTNCARGIHRRHSERQPIHPLRPRSSPQASLPHHPSKYLIPQHPRTISASALLMPPLLDSHWYAMLNAFQPLTLEKAKLLLKLRTPTFSTWNPFPGESSGLDPENVRNSMSKWATYTILSTRHKSQWIDPELWESVFPGLELILRKN